MALSTTATVLTVATDLLSFAGLLKKHIERHDRDPLLSRIHLTSRVALLATTMVELCCSSTERLESLKQMEIKHRVINALVQFFVMGGECDGSFLARLRLLEKGIFAPLIDLSRTLGEATYYEQRRLKECLERDPSTAQVPVFIWEKDGEGDDVQRQVGTRIPTMEECEDKMREMVEITGQAALYRAGAEFGIVSHTLTAFSNYAYEKVGRFLWPPAPSMETPNVLGDDDEIDFLKFDQIPRALWKDPIFSDRTCVITRAPIRRVVGDPTNRCRTLYEEGAIRAHLAINPISPVTNYPLTPEKLVPMPAEQALIDTRLKFYEAEFIKRAQELATGQ